MIEKIRKAMKENNIETVLITNLENEKSSYNLFYASGFKGSSGFTLIGEDFAYLITDFRYEQVSKEQVKECEVIIQKGPMFNELKELVEKHNIAKIHVDPNTFFFEIKTIKKICNVEIDSFENLFYKMREVKSDDEVAKIKKACEITDKAFSHMLEYIKVGMTEKEISNELEHTLKMFGGTKASFDSIVASGPNGALPHATPGDRKVQKCDLITLDFGCYYDRYASDMTRTIAVGDISEEQEKIYNTVLKAQLAGVQAARAGITGKELDQVCRDVITEAGYGEYFRHGTGHGLGLDVHEGPGVSSGNLEPLEVGNVVTVEPGIYVPGLGGVRIEDDILITEDGCKILNTSRKELIKI